MVDRGTSAGGRVLRGRLAEAFEDQAVDGGGVAGCSRWSNQPHASVRATVRHRGVAVGLAVAGTRAVPSGELDVYQSGDATFASAVSLLIRSNGSPPVATNVSGVAVVLTISS
jgi:hypothetical protein